MFAKSPINFHNLPPKEQNKRTEQTMVRDACVCVCLCVSVSLCPSMCLCVHECFGFTFLFFFQNQDDWLLRCSDFGFVEIKTARIGCLLKSACCQKWCVCAHVEASNTTVGGGNLRTSSQQSLPAWSFSCAHVLSRCCLEMPPCRAL